MSADIATALHMRSEDRAQARESAAERSEAEVRTHLLADMRRNKAPRAAVAEWFANAIERQSTTRGERLVGLLLELRDAKTRPTSEITRLLVASDLMVTLDRLLDEAIDEEVTARVEDGVAA